MQKITLDDLRQAPEAHLQNAQAAPLMVELAGQPALIVMSQQEYERLQALDDAFWGARAQRAVAGGYASRDEVEQLVAKLADEAA